MAEFYSATIRLSDRFCGPICLWDSQSVAYEAALSGHVVEYGTRQVKSIRKGFQNAVTRSGVGPLRIHDIRHTAAVTMLSAGIPLEKVAQYLGHSNTSVTFNTYGRYLPSHMDDAAAVLDFTEIRNVNSVR